MKFKRLTALLLTCVMALSMVACGGTDTNTSTPTSTSTSGDDTSESKVDLSQKEAPMLEELVNKGELPALEERLPVASDVMIEPVYEELGAYGGSIDLTYPDNGRWSWGPWFEQSLIRLKADGSGEAEPNIAKDFYSNEDATVWTIELREGMKWSDGSDLTADDLVFYHEHMSVPAIDENRVALDIDDPNYYRVYTGQIYNCWTTTDDEGVKYWSKAEKVDDYTVTFTFAHSKPSFPVNLAVDNKWAILPKDFYVDFVARKDGVTDDPTFPLITEEEALANANEAFGKEWETYGNMSSSIGYYHWDYHIVPSVRSFIASDDKHDTVGETYTLTRNPYFFKTDEEGRQLPYVDEVNIKIINEIDQATLEVMGGEIDLYQISPISDDFSAVAEALQDSHGAFVYSDTSWGSPQLHLNQTVEDLDKRALYQDIRFREALSIMVDRNLLNEAMFGGLSEPSQSSVPVGLIGHDPEWSKQWIEYDPEGANKLLDEITEPWDGEEGTYRKMKGTDKDVEIIISRPNTDYFPEFLQVLQTAGTNVGIKIVDKIDAELNTNILVNKVDAAFEGISVSTPAVRPDNIVPMRNFKCWYGAYGRWYEDGQSTVNGGIEPPPEIMGLLDAYETINTATGDTRDEVVAENVQKIYDLHKENQWTIGYLSSLGARYFANNDLVNVPESYSVVMADEIRFRSVMRIEQLWWDN